MSAESQYPEHADRLPQLLPPEANLNLVGHKEAIQSIISSHEEGKLHHAWLVAGQKGIGKATFAFAIARALLAKTSGEPIERVTQMVANGAHPNLKVIRRAFNHKTGTFAANISVETVRDAVSFFQTSAASAGLRVCIVDSVDDMNANAANALLKTLEEPPANTLFLLTINRLGGTLPTIRSRCRLLKLSVLDDQDVLAVLQNNLQLPADTDVDEILNMARGRPRKAFEAILAMENEFLANLSLRLKRPSDLEDADLLSIASQIASSRDDAIWKISLEMLTNAIASQTKLALANGSNNPALANALSVWEKTTEQLANQAIFNLDKKQTVTSILDAIRDLDRAAQPKNNEYV